MVAKRSSSRVAAASASPGTKGVGARKKTQASMPASLTVDTAAIAQGQADSAGQCGRQRKAKQGQVPRVAKSDDKGEYLDLLTQYLKLRDSNAQHFGKLLFQMSGMCTKSQQGRSWVSKGAMAVEEMHDIGGIIGEAANIRRAQSTQNLRISSSAGDSTRKVQSMHDVKNNHRAAIHQT